MRARAINQLHEVEAVQEPSGESNAEREFLKSGELLFFREGASGTPPADESVFADLRCAGLDAVGAAPEVLER